MSEGTKKKKSKSKSSKVRRGSRDSEDDDLNTNAKVIQEASNIQQDTKAAIRRMQAQAAETKEVGATTLEELENQRAQMYRIQDEGDRVQGQLKTAERLQNRLSRWSLNFNGRAARKQAQTMTDHEKAKDATKQKRREIEAERAESKEKAQEQAVPVVTPHGRGKKNRKNSKKGEADDSKPKKATSKGLLYGTKGETDPDLQRLADEDAEIDEGLDMVSDQLDDLMQMAESMGSEARAQTRGLNDFTDQMAEVNHQQRVVNNRTGRFLSGKVRKNYESESATSATGFW